ncbi:lmo0937 family membrane protein [Paenibacillus sp. FSL H3-0469]
MLWGLIGLVVVVWLLGLIFNFMGNMIHLLLFVAAVLFVINLVKGRTRR